MILRLEVLRERLAPGRLRLPPFGALDFGLLGRLGSLVERPPLLALDDGRGCGRRRFGRRTGLALLTLRYGEQLGDTLVEASQLLDELRILTEKLCELSTLVRILLSQRFQLVHRLVQITLGDLCRSSSLFFRAEVAGTSRGALR